jgi:hypothetical protein
MVFTLHDKILNYLSRDSALWYPPYATIVEVPPTAPPSKASRIFYVIHWKRVFWNHPKYHKKLWNGNSSSVNKLFISLILLRVV